MKPETKKSLFFLFLTVTYFSQAINDAYKFSFVYFFGFMIAVAILYVIRNKYIGALTGLIILLAMEFYDTDYKQLTVIAFLLICAHKSLISGTNSDNKKRLNNFSFFCIQFSIFATIALFIYDVILISEHTVKLNPMHLSRTVMIFLWLIGIFIYSLFKNKNDKQHKLSHKINKQLSGNLRFMYLVSIFGFLATALFSYARIEYVSIGYSSIFFPWFVYICSIVYNNDPYVVLLSEEIENNITKISKNKVK